MSESVLWNEMGNLHMRLGSFEDAISAYGKAIELSPKFGQAYSNLGLAYYAKGKIEDAISLYQKSLELSKMNREQSVAWKRLGDAYQKLGQYEKALAAYKMGDELDLHPETGFEHFNTSSTEEVKPDPLVTESKRETESVLTLDEKPTALASEPDSEKEVELAVDPDEDSVGDDPRDPDDPEPLPPATPPFLTMLDSLAEDTPPEIWHEEGGNQSTGLEYTSLREQAADEEFGELDHWLQSVEAQPSSVMTEHQYSNEDDFSSKPLKAVPPPDSLTNPPSETRFITLDANTTQSRTPLLAPPGIWEPLGPAKETHPVKDTVLVAQPPAQAVLVGQDSRMALFKSWKLSDKPEHDPGVWKGMLEALEKDKAEGNLMAKPVEQTAMVAGENSTHADQSVEINSPNRELMDSIANYRKITEVAPANDKAWDTLGKLLKDAGEYGEAVSAFEHAISLSPNRDIYYYHLGLVYAAQKLHDDAIRAFQKVIDLNPGYILAHCALAGSYRRLGMEREAKEHIKVALPRLEAETEYNRACFEAICGNIDQAVELLKLALEKKQTSPEWVRGDPDLDFIRDDPRFKALVGSSSATLDAPKNLNGEM